MLRTGCLLAPQRDFVVTLRRSGLPYRRPPATALLGHYAGQTLTGKFITAFRTHTTEPSTAPSWASSHCASTSTSSDGPCTSSNDCAAGPTRRGPGCGMPGSGNQRSSPTGTSSRSLPAGLWGPDDRRLSRPVPREREGEVPSRYSPSSTRPGTTSSTRAKGQHGALGRASRVRRTERPGRGCSVRAVIVSGAETGGDSGAVAPLCPGSLLLFDDALGARPARSHHPQWGRAIPEGTVGRWPNHILPVNLRLGCSTVW